MNRRSLVIASVFTAALLLLSAIPLFANTMGSSDGYDLDALWARAQNTFDLAEHDAVLLLESRAVTIGPGGNRVTRVHRVVWIGTARGIRAHADLRIPYNSATSALTIKLLRTWRDDRWWPDESEISPTAVVETLPYAVARTDDYTTMRETMLLHDGVELPCIMETTYEIETDTAADGADGHWVFPQRDPAVVIKLTVSIPSNGSLLFAAGDGSPEPEIARVNATATYEWLMENVEPLGSPVITNPAVYAPYVTWSTWNDWSALGRSIVSSFDAAAVLDDALADTLDSYIEHAPTHASKTRAIAAFVDECSRSIHYSSRHWAFSSRPASRTWDTAYGHGLDRAVLAAALFRHAGLEAQPAYRSNPSVGIDLEIPGLSRFGEIGVRVSGDMVDAFYDPSDGALTDAPVAFEGRVVWNPGSGEAPFLNPVLHDSDRTSRFDLVLRVEPGENDSWKGTGFLDADGLFCPHGEMTGLGGEALALLGKVAESALPGSKVTAFNPEVFESGRIMVGFAFEISALEPDAHDRVGFVLGDPAGGIADRVSHDVHLYHEHRGSPVVLPGKMTQHVRLRIKTGNKTIVHIPETREINNKVGHFSVRSNKDGGWVTVDRKLTVFVPVVEAGAWPDLRSLLLEESDSGGKTILMK